MASLSSAFLSIPPQQSSSPLPKPAELDIAARSSRRRHGGASGNGRGGRAAAAVGGASFCCFSYKSHPLQPYVRGNMHCCGSVVSSRNLRGRRFRCYVSGPSGGDRDEEEEDENDRKTTTAVTNEPEPTSSPSQPNETGHKPVPESITLQMDAFKLLDLLGPEKVDPEDVKLLREKAFGYTTFWVTGQEPFGDLGAGVLFIGNLRGKREEVFAKLQRQLREVTGSKYNLFMVEEPNSEELDPRGGPRDPV